MSSMGSLIPTEVETVDFAAGEPKLNGNGGTVKHSESLGSLASALAKAQLEFEPIKKDTENPYYKSRYADLSGIIAATQKALAKNGLVIIQSPIVDVAKQQAGVVSLMVHSSGEWMSSELILPATMVGRDGKPRFDSQSCGSAQTYSRRYSYQALIGVAAEPDDDGNSSAGIGSHDAAQAVAKDKIARMKANPPQNASQRVSCLFYVESQEHKGFVDWLNIGQYVEQNEDKADALRMVFTAHGAKKRGDATLVPVDKIPSLLEKLAGDLGVDVKQLQAKD